MESLACGVPVTALRWSSNHAESIGAEIAGSDFAVMERDIDAYVACGIEWASDPDARHRAAVAQLERARAKYSAEDFIHQLCDLPLNLTDKT